MKIAICDDDPERSEEIRSRLGDRLGADHAVELHDNTSTALKELSDLRRQADKGELRPRFKTDFDDLDVLIVDYDLVHLDAEGGRTSGEGVARLVKAYSACKYVVVLNQFSRAAFDLSLLGHPGSLADLNLNEEIVDEPVLWDLAGSEFTPVYWPRIPVVLEGWETFKRGLPEDLSWSVFETLELSPSDMGDLSDLAFSHLSSTATTLEELAKVTALEFVKKLIGPEANQIVQAGRSDILIHFAVSRVAKWLDRCVVRPLEPLIDILHLAERRPYLIDATSKELGSPDFWETLDSSVSERLARHTPKTAFCARAELLLGKPVAVALRLDDDEAIQALSDKFAYHDLADFVLAEDTSKFVRRDEATEFRAGFGNFSDRRYVKRLNGYQYGPQRRFAFGAG